VKIPPRGSLAHFFTPITELGIVWVSAKGEFRYTIVSHDVGLLLILSRFGVFIVLVNRLCHVITEWRFEPGSPRWPPGGLSTTPPADAQSTFFSETFNVLLDDSIESLQCGKGNRPSAWTAPSTSDYAGEVDKSIEFKWQDPATYQGPVVQGWEPGEKRPGVDPTTTSYNASVVKIYIQRN
jgi:hypothetical protein